MRYIKCEIRLDVVFVLVTKSTVFRGSIGSILFNMKKTRVLKSINKKKKKTPCFIIVKGVVVVVVVVQEEHVGVIV